MRIDQNGAAAPIQHILICGGGLAAHMTAAALSNQLPHSMRITLASLTDTSSTDLFYGSVSAPSAYAFNRSVGLSEPTLVLESDTGFSWGTKYVHWAGGSRSWIQCFELPFPVVDGVLFHHYLAQQGVEQLERYLVSASAARKGVFAHPPRQAGQASRGGQYLFSRSEYGYQFDPTSYAALFARRTNAARVQQVDSKLSKIERGTSGISAIHLSDGRTLTADLYVDCTGPEALLLSSLGVSFSGERKLGAAMGERSVRELGPAVRTITPADYGWHADTPLQGRQTRLTVYHPDAESDALSAHGNEPKRTGCVTLGRRAQAWFENCVGIGQAACVVEPLTPAPLMLLERDVERLVSLIPVSCDMAVERREFARRSAEDHEHAELFTKALFETDGLPETPYWLAARGARINEKLARKIELFQDRGVLVAYDYEPFHPEDWTVLHYGMGRRPRRYDRSADRASGAQVRQFLSNMERDVEQVVEALPSHSRYMAELQRYLMQNKR